MEDARPPLVGLQPQGQVTSFKRRLVSRIKMKSVRKQLRMGGGVLPGTGLQREAERKYKEEV